MNFAKRPSHGSLLVLYGNNGAGKTHCAKAVYRWANRVSGNLPLVACEEGHFKRPDAMFAHWPTFMDGMKGGDWDLVRDAEEATLLILDEIGGGYDPSLMGTDKLCRILSTRQTMFTIITTNLVPDAWEKALDRRIASRLFRNATHVDLTEVPDYSVT